MVIIVTGLAGSGKTTLSTKLSKRVVHSDTFRYYTGTWNKLPYTVFREAIFNAISDDIVHSAVYESTYRDAHDREESRKRVIDELIESGKATKLVVIKPTTLKNDLTSVVARSMRRARGEEKGAAAELPENVTALILKFVQEYDENCNALNLLIRKASELGIETHLIEPYSDDWKDILTV